MCEIIHIYKRSYNDQKHTYLGSTKDIWSRKEYFKSRNIRVYEVLVSDKTRYDLYLKSDKKIDWLNCKAVLMEMTFSPKAIAYIRKKAPKAKIIVRSHNAELLHRIHWALAEGIKKNAIRYYMQAIRYFYADFQFGRFADAILSIDEWEVNHYWAYIGKNNTEYVPFYLPQKYENELLHPEKKDFSCVNFTSSIMNPIISDATNNFLNLVNQIDGRCSQWKFFITGKLSHKKNKIPENVIQTGWLENPYSVLKPARAMALLSNLGYGFKTKILEAIIAKTYVLVPHGLYARLPNSIKKYCKCVDVKSVTSFSKALDECREPFPENNLNKLLKMRAFMALDNVLSI